jgi:succinate dehydrogenase / fumarate reductase cytochrome b subunit
MWSWVLHRITGATIFFFLFVHVLDTALVRVSPQAYNEVIDTYKTPIVGLMEVGLVAAVLYHALNGIRIILIDFWARGPKYQRLMLWIVLGVWIAVFIAALGVIGMHMAKRPGECGQRTPTTTSASAAVPPPSCSATTTAPPPWTTPARHAGAAGCPTSRSTPGCSCECLVSSSSFSPLVTSSSC